MIYVTLINSQDLPSRKSKNTKIKLKSIQCYSNLTKLNLKEIEAVVKGNTLSRELTMTPPNDLTPTIYRSLVKKLAKQNGW